MILTFAGIMDIIDLQPILLAMETEDELNQIAPHESYHCKSPFPFSLFGFTSSAIIPIVIISLK